MTLPELLRTECLQVGMQAADKDDALHKLATLAAQSPLLGTVDEADLYRALKEREELGTTAFGEGIAIPHCRLPQTEQFVVGLATCPEGVDFAALDEQPVKLFVLIIAPEGQSDEHIRLLSAVSQVLRIPGAPEELIGAASCEGLRESFLRHVRDEAETTDHAGRHLFHVLVQDEERFEDILEVFAAMEAASVMVTEGQRTSVYLAKTPLFAGFWSDAERGFDRIILAAVDKKLTNDTIRRIEQITGPLDECRSVMVAVQEIFYSAGRIEA
jgi:PTS system nitrogen regulatory IIA component